MGNETSARAFLENLSDLEKVLRSGKSDKSVQAKHGWNGNGGGITVLQDYITIKLTSTHRNKDAIRGNVGYGSDVHFFEFYWNPGTNKKVVIGIATEDADLGGKGSDIILGADDKSVGFDLVSRKIYFNGTEVKTLPKGKPHTYTIPNPITMVVNMDKGTLSFKTRDDDFGVAMKGLKYLANAVYVAAQLEEEGDQITMKYLGGSDKVSDIGQSNTNADLCFHEICGKNVMLHEGNRRALRKNPKLCFGNSTVLTNRPLKDNEMFKLVLVTVDRSRWRGSWMFGVTTISPLELTFHEEMVTTDQRNVWLYVANKIFYNKRCIEELNCDLNDLETGTTVGVKRQGDKLVFYVDGLRQATLTVNTDEPLYGVIDLYGQATCVSMIDVGANPSQEESSQRTGPKTSDEYLSGLKHVVEAMKTKSRDTVSKVKTLLKLNLDEMYHKIKSKRLRQLAAEKLANMEAGKVFTEYCIFLRGLHPESDPLLLETYESLLSVIWNYSDNSLALAKKFGQARLLDFLITILRDRGGNYKENKYQIVEVLSCFGILHNCAKAVENRPIYRRNKFMQVSKPYCNARSNPKEISMPAIFTKSYVFEEDEVNELEIPEPTAQDTVNTLARAVMNPETHQQDGWHAHEIAVGISNLSANPTNVKYLVQKGAVKHLIKMLDFEDGYEQECGLNAIWSLTNDINKTEVAYTSGLNGKVEELTKSKVEGVSQAAIRLKMKLETEMPTYEHIMTTVIGTAKTSTCEYKNLCATFKSSLKLADDYFNPDFDICYCAICHGKRGDKTKFIRGIPPKEYGVPVGWYRFGLHLPAKAKALGALEKWHRAFHGTKQDHIKGILEVGEIVPAGRPVFGGRTIKEQPGHYNDDVKPDGFNTKQVFLSPSMRYSGVDAYSTPCQYKHPETGKRYTTKVAFQVLINPGSYVVGPETIGAMSEIDPGFSNQELEWSTEEQGSTILYGILVKLEG